MAPSSVKMKPKEALYGLYAVFFGYACVYFDYPIFFWLGFGVIVMRTVMEDRQEVPRKLPMVHQLVRTTFYFVLIVLFKLTLELLYYFDVLRSSQKVRDENDSDFTPVEDDSTLTLGRMGHIFLLVGFMFSLVRFIINAYRLLKKVNRAIRIHLREHV